jgi:hypothetical protein
MVAILVLLSALWLTMSKSLSEIFIFVLLRYFLFYKTSFAVGVTLDELSALSTDEFWNQSVTLQSSSAIYKLLKLRNLGIYCQTDTTDSDLDHVSIINSVFYFTIRLAVPNESLFG